MAINIPLPEGVMVDKWYPSEITEDDIDSDEDDGLMFYVEQLLAEQRKTNDLLQSLVDSVKRIDPAYIVASLAAQKLIADIAANGYSEAGNQS